jgi:hypothetical protein
MTKRNLRARMLFGVAALAFGVTSTAAAFAQSGPYYPSDRKLDDNGSVYEPGPGPGAAARAYVAREERVHLTPVAPARQYYPTDRKPDDNGSVDEPGPGH